MKMQYVTKKPPLHTHTKFVRFPFPLVNPPSVFGASAHTPNRCERGECALGDGLTTTRSRLKGHEGTGAWVKVTYCIMMGRDGVNNTT